MIKRLRRKAAALLGPVALGVLCGVLYALASPWPHHNVDERLAFALATVGVVVGISALPMWEWAKRPAEHGKELRRGEAGASIAAGGTSPTVGDRDRVRVQGTAVVGDAESDVIGVNADRAPDGGVYGEARADRAHPGSRVIGVNISLRPPEKS